MAITAIGANVTMIQFQDEPTGLELAAQDDLSDEFPSKLLERQKLAKKIIRLVAQEDLTPLAPGIFPDLTPEQSQEFEERLDLAERVLGLMKAEDTPTASKRSRLFKEDIIDYLRRAPREDSVDNTFELFNSHRPIAIQLLYNLAGLMDAAAEVGVPNIIVIVGKAVDAVMTCAPFFTISEESARRNNRKRKMFISPGTITGVQRLTEIAPRYSPLYDLLHQHFLLTLKSWSAGRVNRLVAQMVIASDDPANTPADIAERLPQGVKLIAAEARGIDLDGPCKADASEENRNLRRSFLAKLRQINKNLTTHAGKYGQSLTVAPLMPEIT